MAAGGAVIGALRVVLGADSAALETGLKKASSQLDAFAARMNKIGIGIGVGIAGAATALGLAIKGTINEADKLGKMAQSIGVPVDELSRLKHAADLSGVGIEELGKSLGKLSRNMVEAATNIKGDAARAFQTLKIEVQNSDKTLKSSSQVMTEIAGKFGGMEDGAGKTALAIALFGRAGAALIPLLNAGSSGLKTMMAEADALGIVLDTKTAKSAEAFNDNLRRMGKIWDGIILQITSRMLPAFLQMSQVMLDAAKNSSVMQTAADGIVTFLKGAVTAALTAALVFQRLGAEFSALWQALSAPNWEGMKAGFAAFTAAGEETKARFEGLKDFIGKFWSDAGNASEAAAGTVGPKIAAPIIKGAEMAKNALESFLSSTAKRQASLTAELQTIGLSVGAHERLRIVLEAEAIAKENNIPITESLRQKIEQTATGYGQLAEQVDKAKENFSNAKSDAASLGSSLENAFNSAVISGNKFKDVAKSLLQDLAKLASHMAFRALLGGGSGDNIFTPLFAGAGSSHGITGVAPFAKGFARGGSFTVGGSGGIDSQRVSFNATPGERVSVSKDGGGGVTNNVVIENHGAQVQAGQSERNSTGGFNLKLMVRAATDENLSSGAHDSVMGRYGVRPRGTRR